MQVCFLHDITPIRLIDVLQKTKWFFFFLHYINLHVVEIGLSGAFWINQLVLIEKWRPAQPFKHKKSWTCLPPLKPASFQSQIDSYKTLIHDAACFALILDSDWIYIFCGSLFHQEETRAVFSLGVYFKRSRLAGECVLSLVSHGDSGHLYEQCLQCSLIDWVSLLVMCNYCWVTWYCHSSPDVNQDCQYHFLS